MPIQLTIVGLGQIGASAGLALASQSERVRRVGHDRDLHTARQAEKLGAVDKVSFNLLSAVQEADLVLLALPMDQIRETLAAIAPELKEGAVVMDTGPVKTVVAAWAGELLPAGRHYVGLTPAINPAYLVEAERGLPAARQDLFKNGLIAVTAPQRTPSAAIKLGTDLVQLLGASPLFADLIEVDSLMAATHTLPQLLGAALLSMTVDRPGWREVRKMAGRGYTHATAALAHLDEPQAIQSTALLNPENVLRVLDGAIAELQALRQEIASQDLPGLEIRLERARRGRDLWWKQRQEANWAAEEDLHKIQAPTSGEMLGRIFGLGQKKYKDR